MTVLNEMAMKTVSETDFTEVCLELRSISRIEFVVQMSRTSTEVTVASAKFWREFFNSLLSLHVSPGT